MPQDNASRVILSSYLLDTTLATATYIANCGNRIRGRSAGPHRMGASTRNQIFQLFVRQVAASRLCQKFIRRLSLGLRGDIDRVQQFIGNVNIIPASHSDLASIIARGR